MNARRPRTQRGFSFIEILVVMGIISVLVSMVVVVIPMIQEESKRTKSVDNVRSLLLFMTPRVTKKGWKSFPFSGKNFTLAPVAFGDLDKSRSQNLEILFSPGDPVLGLAALDIKRYDEVTREALKSGSNFQDLTSYAGRRNADPDFRITSKQESAGTMVLADDDRGPCHHKAGIVVGYTSGDARFLEWEELGIDAPEDVDEPDEFLGDSAQNDELRKLWGE